MYDADMAELTRITVNLIPKADDALTWLAEHTGMNRTDVINRALQLYQFTEERAAEGDKLTLLKPDGQLDTVRIL